ncbi:MAG TPA: hypothetical protein VEG39_15485 [Clostridia bacterium]|nr:hypothetical protein [Clostridia bacterium]
MYRKLLNNQFFKDNPVKELTAQQLVYSKILMPEFEDIAEKVVTALTGRTEAEAMRIKEENNPEVILKFLRSKCDTLNYNILRHKVLEYEEQLLPKIIEMLIRSGNDVFIVHIG